MEEGTRDVPGGGGGCVCRCPTEYIFPVKASLRGDLARSISALCSIPMFGMSPARILRSPAFFMSVWKGAADFGRFKGGSSGLLIPWIAIFAVILVSPAARGDNLALLSGTLRMYQRAGCEGEVMTLRCPQGTSISVQVAQYGRPPPSSPQHHTAASSSTLYRPPPLCPGNALAAHKGNTTCHWPSALQYSLLQTVVEICQKKRQCKFQVTAKELGGSAAVDDICPGSSKFVEVAYKCSPFEFRSKVACEDESTELHCGSHTRLAIYSASFGRTEYESIKCPQPQGVPEETCLVSYATETAMQECHGKRKCILVANAATFGNPCRERSQTYLKVIYTCVPRKVLQQSYQDKDEAWEGEEDEGEEEEEEEEGAGGGNEYDSYGGGTDDLFRESSAFSPPPNPDSDSEFGGGPGKAQPSLVGKSAPGGGGPTPRQHSEGNKTSSGNVDNVFLYVFLSLGGGLVVLLSVAAGRFYLGRRKESKRTRKREGSSSSSAHSASPSGAVGVGGDGDSRGGLPNGFLASKEVDIMSDIDAGIDLMVASPGRRYMGGVDVGGRGVIATTSAGVPLPPPAVPVAQTLPGEGQVVCYGHPRGGGSVLGVRFQCSDDVDPSSPSGNNQYYYS